jgi:choline dehydrogenase
MSLLDEATDRDALIRGCRLAETALMLGPGRSMNGHIYAPAGRLASDLDWLDFMRETASLNWHPTSTCRMGNGPEDVVGLDLKVHGLESLSVVDASVMPFVTSANTNIPVVAIAERSAEIIAGRTGG